MLVAANISDVKPNQFTRKMAHYARDVFSPRGIEYKYTRTEQKRLFEFFHDDDDGDDDDIDITQLSGWGIPERPSPSSPSSLGALEGSKHSVWISTTHFWGEPQTPEATQMLQFSQICAPSIDRLVNSVLS